jgi:hypothetical protein
MHKNFSKEIEEDIKMKKPCNLESLSARHATVTLDFPEGEGRTRGEFDIQRTVSRYIFL